MSHSEMRAVFLRLLQKEQSSLRTRTLSDLPGDR
jgi:hypothetical protein